MDDKELNDLRKSIFGDVEKKAASTEKADMFQSLFGDLDKEPAAALLERPPSPPPAPVSFPPPQVGEAAAPAEGPEAPAEPEEEDEILTLREIKMMISRYRLNIAESEKRLRDLRYKLMGLETEYRVLMGEEATPPPPPTLESPPESPLAEAPEAALQGALLSPPPARAKQKARAWDDAATIGLEEAAWRVLLSEGKSLPPWRVVAAIKRMGVKRPFTEDALVTEVRRSRRLGISGGGHIHIK